MLRRFALAFGLILTPVAVQAASEVTEFFLENGLQVVVIEDHRTPAVVHMMWYRTGAADEPPGQSGIAPFVEHLMFKATDELESGEFSRVVEANGGSDNAFTSWDYTGYFQRVAADRLGLMMQMEADRMTDLVFDPQEVTTERSVILEERAQRLDSSPGALFNEQMRATMFLNHPYGVPIIGWRHEMEELSIDDARAFYDTYYAPNNAILIVAGDATPEEVRRLAEEHYGPIPASPTLPERIRPLEPLHNADRRVMFEDERVARPYVSVSYLAPNRVSGDQGDAAAAVLLAQVLGGSGQTAVLSRTLQVEEERALFAGAYYNATGLNADTFTVVNVPVPGIPLEDAEADLHRVLATFLEDGIDPAQFERIQFQVQASRIYEEDSVQGLARSYGAALTSGLTVDDVQKLARCDRGHNARGCHGVGAPSVHGNQQCDRVSDPTRSPHPGGEPMIGRFTAFVTAAFLALPAAADIDIQEVTSPGGIEAWLVEDDSIPFVALEIWFMGGASLDEPGKRGATFMMMGLLEEGTGDMDAQAFAEEVEGFAASFDFNSYRDAVAIGARMLSQNRDEAALLLRDCFDITQFRANRGRADQGSGYLDHRR